jgi:hypothetical protein
MHKTLPHTFDFLQVTQLNEGQIYIFQVSTREMCGSDSGEGLERAAVIEW